MNLHVYHDKLPNSFLLSELVPYSKGKGKTTHIVAYHCGSAALKTPSLQAGRPGGKRAGGGAGQAPVFLPKSSVRDPWMGRVRWGERLELSWDTECLNAAWIAFVLGHSSLREILQSGEHPGPLPGNASNPRSCAPVSVTMKNNFHAC